MPVWLWALTDREVVEQVGIGGSKPCPDLPWHPLGSRLDSRESLQNNRAQ